MNTEVLENNLKEARDAAARNPDDLQLQIALGEAHFRLSHYDEALAAFERAIGHESTAAEAYSWMGRVYYHTGPLTKAFDAYRRAAKLDQKCTEAYFGLGLLYLWKVGNNEAAVEVLQEALRHNPGDALLTTALGSAYAFSGQFDDAIAALKRGIRLQPENEFAYSWLADIYFHLGRYDDTIASCVRGSEIEDTHDAHRLMGYVFEWRGLHDEAIAQFETAISLAPEDYEARAALAGVYRAANRPREAERQYAIAHKLAMEDDEYGQACFEAVSGNRNRALDLLEVALHNQPSKRNWARLDPEFASIKDDERFQVLSA
jgi:tetratricopeptide (TPR) repeat protein